MRNRLKRITSALIALTLFPMAFATAMQDEQETSLEDTDLQPTLYVSAPTGSASYDSGNRLTVRASGSNIQRITLSLKLADHTLTYKATGDSVEYTFTFDTPQTQGATLTVRGYAGDAADNNSACAEQTVAVLSPKQEIIERMIALAYANSKDSRYQFAPAETDYDIGVCKNFVMRLFDTFSKEYRMLAYPELALHMPNNNSKKACAPYDYGIEWKPETAAEGSPFEIAAQFKYDDSLTQEENDELARNLLIQIQKGDFFQIVGYYGGGNGPHSMYIIRDYDPVTQMIHWTDSNMRGTRVNGARWGYMQYNADADVPWWVQVFSMKKRGATLYRLRDDLYKY